MMQKHALILASLLSTGVMAQWQQVGLWGEVPTTGGIQVVDDVLYFHPANDKGLIFRSEDKGATWHGIRFADQGDSWKILPHHGVDYVNGGAHLAGPSDLFRSVLGINEWVDLNVNVLDFIVVGENRLLVCAVHNGQTAILRSDDSGNTWENGFPLPDGLQVRLIGQDGQGRLLVQAYGDPLSDGLQAGLYRSADLGDTWTQISDVKFDLSGASAHADGSIYACNGMRVLRSNNNGENWQVVPVSFPYSTLTGARVFNMGGGHLYFTCHEAGSTQEYYMRESFDQGITWSPVTFEVAQHLVFNMVMDSDGSLFAATDNGVYRQDPAAPVAVQEQAQGVHVYAYPVPTSDNVLVNTGGELIEELRLFDAAGHEVAFVPQVGKPAYLLRVGHLPAGMYVLRAATAKGVSTAQVAVE
ncbi:MAG: T9SS type A sorting domain-containing protein [Flavobacteriales bacterium]|nr:T9SS type A sorting domain-containing protein [Flavobacteriales bacterium]